MVIPSSWKHFWAAQVPIKVKVVQDVVSLAPYLGSLLELLPHSLLEWSGLGYTLVSHTSTVDVIMGCLEERNQHLWSGEALACGLACRVVVENNLKHVMFESDCLQVMEAIHAEGDDTSDFGRIIDDKPLLYYLLS